jgi:MerR family transcriptional regulator, redox-sensitive transcriptional activator SoxR
MADLTILEVARRSGLRTSPIRYYEKIGLLPRAVRFRHQRRYDSLILERLAIIRFAQYVGLRLTEIKWLLNDVPGRPPPERWRKLAKERLKQVDSLITDAQAIKGLLQMTIDRKCPKLVEYGIRLPWRSKAIDVY